VFRIVLDTNIIVSAIQFGGLPAEILRLGLADEIKLYISKEIIIEVIGVLRKKFNYEREVLKEVVELILGTFTLVTPKERVRIIKNQPADNRILECGLAAKANYVVSGDKKHLLSLGRYRRIRIISVKEFLEVLRKSYFEELMKNRRKNSGIPYGQVKSDISKATTVIRKNIKKSYS